MTRNMYSWTKRYAVHTPIDDEVAVGDIIMVDSGGGPSNQKVVSVTVMKNRTGEGYKVVLVQEATQDDINAFKAWQAEHAAEVGS